MSHRGFAPGLAPARQRITGKQPPRAERPEPHPFWARSVSSMRLEMLGTAALVRDMVPVQRVYDGKCGLLDNVATNFYGYYGDRADFTAHFSSGMLIIVR